MSQKNMSSAVELSFQLRHALQGRYTGQYGTLPYLNAPELYGTSFGATTGYLVPLGRGWSVTPSAGYYKFSVDKIINRTIPVTLLPGSHTRLLANRPDSTPLGYATRGYHYNNLRLGVSAGETFRLAQRYQLTAGIAMTCLFTYSAPYMVGGTSHQTADFRNFGHMLTGQPGIRRAYQPFYAAAHVLLPLHKQWKKDRLLFEDPTETVKTRFGGYGISPTVGRYLP